MRLLLLIAAIVYAVSCSCPSGFTLTHDGICTILAKSGVLDVFNNGYNEAVSTCKQYGATPVIIQNQQDQDYWASRVNNPPNYLIIGLQCDTAAKRWKWADGSAVTYIPPYTSSDLTATCNSNTNVWHLGNDAGWYMSASTAIYPMDIYCQYIDNQEPEIPGEYCADFTEGSGDSTCYQVGIHAEDWIEAQTVCRSFGSNIASVHSSQENSFIRRLAASKGLVDGLMLGGTIAGKNNKFGWIDGSEWNYDNYAAGFPIDGLGKCLAMDTNDVDGKWINLDCATPIPYVCERRANVTMPACGDFIPVEGEILYSPGFPNNASAPCDFFLKVDADKLVEVEILFLEANPCCDHLVLSEGSFGGNIVANLTGEISAGATFRTSSSNLMRASWQPNGGVNVRGMMITFRGVDK